MFVSAYLDAARVLDGAVGGECRAGSRSKLSTACSRSLERIARLRHRIGGPALEGSLDDQVFGVLALLDAYEATLESRYFDAAKKTMDLAIARYGDCRRRRLFRSPQRRRSHGRPRSPP